DADLLGLDFELAEAAPARIDVEPQVAVLVAGEAVGGGSVSAVLALNLDVLHFSGLGVDLADGDAGVRIVDRVVEVAVEAHGAVVRQLAELRGSAEVPVVAVIDGIFRSERAGTRPGVERQVRGLPYDAGGFPGRPRAVLELHRGFARAAGTGKISREVLAVEFDDAVGLGIRALIDAGVGDVLHQVDDLVPARLVELELQRIARRVAAGAL